VLEFFLLMTSRYGTTLYTINSENWQRCKFMTERVTQDASDTPVRTWWSAPFRAQCEDYVYFSAQYMFQLSLLKLLNFILCTIVRYITFLPSILWTIYFQCLQLFWLCMKYVSRTPGSEPLIFSCNASPVNAVSILQHLSLSTTVGSASRFKAER
jgi:hypothetical protein